jgi:hypothetical protein
MTVLEYSVSCIEQDAVVAIQYLDTVTVGPHLTLVLHS